MTFYSYQGCRNRKSVDQSHQKNSFSKSLVQSKNDKLVVIIVLPHLLQSAVS